MANLLVQLGDQACLILLLLSSIGAKELRYTLGKSLLPSMYLTGMGLEAAGQLGNGLFSLDYG